MPVTVHPNLYSENPVPKAEGTVGGLPAHPAFAYVVAIFLPLTAPLFVEGADGN
jgi:hypothetical protein